jgi:ABC-type amino acid transport substrate-binding protein
MRKLSALILALVLALSLAACNGSKSDTSSDPANTSEEPKTLTIGLANGIAKVSYLDEEGEWQGYDYELLLKIDELLPQYVFTYDPLTDFAAGFTGLDTKKYDFLSFHLGWNAEREEKYLYGNTSFYENAGLGLNIKKGSKIVINSEEDLGGLKISVPPGVSFAGDVEKFNKEHPDNPIDVVWNTGTVEQQLADLQSGAFDGLFGSSDNNVALKEAYGDIFDTTGENLFYDASQKNGTYFLFNYGNESLRDEIDEAITKLLEDGTLSQLSGEIFGIDVTVKP